MVRFSNPLALSGSADQLPAGQHEVGTGEERLQGSSFQPSRRAATFLTGHNRAGRPEIRPTSEQELSMARGNDGSITENENDSEAALSPPEDLK
jgi:hypothetical protein